MDSEKIESGFRTLGPIPKNAPLGLRKGACDLADFPSKVVSKPREIAAQSKLRCRADHSLLNADLLPLHYFLLLKQIFCRSYPDTFHSSGERTEFCFGFYG